MGRATIFESQSLAGDLPSPPWSSFGYRRLAPVPSSQFWTHVRVQFEEFRHTRRTGSTFHCRFVRLMSNEATIERTRESERLRTFWFRLGHSILATQSSMKHASSKKKKNTSTLLKIDILLGNEPNFDSKLAALNLYSFNLRCARISYTRGSLP